MDFRQVMNSLKTKENEIKKLEEKMILLEKSIDSLKTHKPSESFKCNLCEYECAASTALKSHITKKHKEELRESSSVPDLKVSLGSEDRDETPPSASLFFDTSFICKFCSREKNIHLTTKWPHFNVSRHKHSTSLQMGAQHLPHLQQIIPPNRRLQEPHDAIPWFF
jgi:hypothetical protein